MNTSTNQGLADLRTRIEDVQFGMFTTSDDTGILSSRPMTCQQIDEQGRMWFFTSDETPFVAGLVGRPLVNITFVEPKNNLYISVSGHAVLLKDRTKATELWNPKIGTWFSGGLDDPNLSLITVDIHSAEYWDTASSTMTQIFAMAKGIFTGERPADAGEHVKIDL